MDIQELEILANLKARGVITENELEAAKDKYLSERGIKVIE